MVWARNLIQNFRVLILQPGTQLFWPKNCCTALYCDVVEGLWSALPQFIFLQYPKSRPRMDGVSQKHTRDYHGLTQEPHSEFRSFDFAALDSAFFPQNRCTALKCDVVERVMERFASKLTFCSTQKGVREWVV